MLRIRNKNGEHKPINYLPLGFISLVSILMGFFGVIFFSENLPLITAYFGIIGNIGIGMVLWYLVDRWVMGEVNTIEEIKKGNVAYAIFALGILVLIAAAIIAT